MERRKFNTLMGLAAGSIISYGAKMTDGTESSTPKLNRPKHLKKGSKIGLITPGSSMTQDQVRLAHDNLKSLGFTVVESKNFNKRKGFIAGSDQERVDDIHEMFARKDIEGIICGRGGYGTARLLGLLDYDLIRKNPKVFVGFSDITALLYAFQERANLLCFHGPVASSTFSPFTKSNFSSVLSKPNKHLSLQRPKTWKNKSERSFQSFTINEGNAEGQLVGGNLSIICSMLGTPYDISFKDKIVFIEEIGEPLYRIDRMLTQLLLADKFKDAKGIVFGVLANCESIMGGKYDDVITIQSVITERLSALKIPIVYGLPIGHIDDNATLPLGAKCRLDTQKMSLTILETPVI